jgi:hypothetical protein
VNKQMTTRFALTIAATAALLTLAACGGGGGSNTASAASPASSSTANSGTSSSPANTPSVTTGDVSTPQYAANSAQLAAFNLLNQYRQQCGFPALQENTVLDTAAQNHAKYMGLNNAVSDNEISGNSGFTGATYAARAAASGFPSASVGLGVSDVYATLTSSFTAVQAGEASIYGLLGGVYHADIAAFPVATVGIGEYETQTTSGAYSFTNSWESMSLLNTQYVSLSSAPLTFPCQGVSGVAYKELAEIPTPPNVSSSGWGTPVVVMGNSTDTIVLQTGTMSDASGNVINLQLLSAATDPNKELAAFQAVAYPASPLAANTMYSVSLTGTVNGTPFSRNFTFTTGNVVG